MDYKVIITEDAEADMDKFVRYLCLRRMNRQHVTDKFQVYFTLASNII